MAISQINSCSKVFAELFFKKATVSSFPRLPLRLEAAEELNGLCHHFVHLSVVSTAGKVTPNFDSVAYLTLVEKEGLHNYHTLVVNILKSLADLSPRHISACAGELTVSFTNVNVSNHVACKTECVADVVFLDVHVECVEKELNGVLSNVSAELEAFLNGVEDAGLKAVEDLESDGETETVSMVTNDLHALNSACPKSFLVDVNEIIGPVVVASADEDLTVKLYHLVEDSAEELNASFSNCRICAGNVLILGRAEVSGDLKTEILSGNAKLFKLSVAHVKKIACAYFKDVKSASLCSLAKLNVVY